LKDGLGGKIIGQNPACLCRKLYPGVIVLELDKRGPCGGRSFDRWAQHQIENPAATPR
jgi:hypothetical protein